MGSQFTPGPWSTHGDGIVRHKTNPIKLGSGWRENAWCGEDADPETLANANLAAAAPELCDMLETALDEYEEHNGKRLHGPHWSTSARELLARARGEA